MPAFTLPLWEAIELSGGVVDFSTGIAKMTGGDIGLGHYPIFDETYRDTLNGKIIDHYWNREIGLETTDMFRMAMRVKMNEIMPLYNQYYKSAQLEIDPFSTIDIHTVASSNTTQDSTNDATNNTTSDSTNKSRSVQSETPQTMLQGSEDYATAAADVNGEAEATSTATENATGNVTAEAASDNRTSGYTGLQADMLLRLRETFLNIDIQVITSLVDCFMLVYDTGDTYTQNNYGFGYGLGPFGGYPL